VLGLWSFVRFAHVLSAAVWVGGQLVISALLLPVARRRLPPAIRLELLTDLGRRFGIWTAVGFLPIQIGTGIALASHKGVTFASLGDPGYGRTLATKLGVFAVVMALAAVHGIARSRGNTQLARGCAVASLLGSIWIIVLATALPVT
jgi:uncharacterized membrane protein